MIMWSSAVGCIVILILGLLVAPLAAHAQQPAKVPRVGVLWERTPTDPFIAAFRQGLRELGYTEGQSIGIEERYAYGVVDRYPALMAELLDLNIDVLVVAGTNAAQAAKARTSTVPQVSRVTVLYNAVNPVNRLALQEAREAARSLAMELQALEVRQGNDLASAFAALTAWRAEAVLAFPGPPFATELAHLAQLAAAHRVPAMFIRKEFVEVGGLLAYGPSYADNFRRAATYVDKILKGAKPADLPVEQPMKYELVINLKTTQALGLTMPPTFLFQADEVIQ